MIALRLLRSAGYVALAGLAVALVQSTMTTLNLVKVDGGLHSSLASTKQLVQINQAIIRNNASLPSVVARAKQASGQLQTVLAETSHIHSHIQAINQLNADTLHTNMQMSSVAGGTGQSLQSVVKDTQSLKSYLEQVQGDLRALKAITDTDKRYLDSMKQSADTMNKKTPGVG